MIANYENPAQVSQQLSDVGYLSSDEIAVAVYLAQRLKKPILVEGPAGTGKTQLAKSLAQATQSELIRLQCYEGLDESRALYEWDYQKQLLRIQAANLDQGASWDSLSEDIFSEQFLLERPLLKALRNSKPTVLLVDEVDRLEIETEALLLEILSDFQVSIPELGTISATQQPIVVLTSNNTRELSEALKRRCLFLYLGYPDKNRELEIVLAKFPDMEQSLAKRLVEFVSLMRDMDLKKSPSVSETLDWAEALIALNIRDLTKAEVEAGLPILLKYVEDIETAKQKLKAVNVDN